MADGRKATTGQPSGATTTAARLARKRASWPPSPSSFSALSCTVHDRVAIVTKAVAENTSAASNLAGYPSESSLMDALARYAHTARTLREREREREIRLPKPVQGVDIDMEKDGERMLCFGHLTTFLFTIEPRTTVSSLPFWPSSSLSG